MNRHQPWQRRKAVAASPRPHPQPQVVFAALAAALVALVTGCSWTVAQPAGCTDAVLSARLDRAAELYLSGRAEQSLALLDAVDDQAASGPCAGRLLLARACSALMAATTPQQTAAALQRWQQWRQLNHPADGSFERLWIDPLIQVKLAQLAAAAWSRPPEQQDDQHAGRLQERIDQLEQQVQRLKAQLKALEAIDRSIERKKKALP